MKIVVLASFAESLVIFRGQLLAALARAGHEVSACAPENYPDIAHRLTDLGVTYHSVPLQRAGFNPLADLAYLVRLTRFLKTQKPEIVLGYTIKPVIYGSLAARLSGVPHVYSMITGLGYAFQSESWRHHLLNRMVRVLYRLALAKNEAVFFQNPDDRALFLQLGLVKSTARTPLINGSGVDLVYFAPAPWPTGPPVFLLIARMLKHKGVVEYVEAARWLKRRYPGVALRLVGTIDPNPTAIRREQIQAWESEGVVEYHDWLSDVRPALAAASVYVLPSYREGTPRTVLEAMAMARPIVTTDVPGCRETVCEGDNGFLVPAKNSEALARAMERFVREPALIARLGLRSRQLAERKYDVHQVNDTILRVMGLRQNCESLTSSPGDWTRGGVVQELS